MAEKKEALQPPKPPASPPPPPRKLVRFVFPRGATPEEVFEGILELAKRHAPPPKP